MADIVVDTDKLEQYADRLQKVHSRVKDLDGRLNGLYLKVGLLGLDDLLVADALTGFNLRLVRCKTYLNETALDFKRVEEEIMKQDPLKFKEPLPIADTLEMLRIIPIPQMGFLSLDDLSSLGEVCTWLEEVYKTRPEWVQIVIDTVVPGQLIDLYTVASGILQGDLTAEECLDVISNMMARTTVEMALTPGGQVTALVGLAGLIVVECVEYRMESGAEKNTRNWDKIKAQYSEGDFLGGMLAELEYMADSIGGLDDLVFSTTGELLDASIDVAPISYLKNKAGKVVAKNLQNVPGIFGAVYEHDTGKSPGEWMESFGEKSTKIEDQLSNIVFEYWEDKSDNVSQSIRNISSILADLSL